MSKTCFECAKHKLTLIFYNNSSQNKQLKEIKEEHVVRSVKELLGISPIEKDLLAPFVAGSIV